MTLIDRIAARLGYVPKPKDFSLKHTDDRDIQRVSEATAEMSMREVYLQFVEHLRPGDYALVKCNVRGGDRAGRVRSSLAPWMTEEWGEGTFATKVLAEANIMYVVRHARMDAFPWGQITQGSSGAAASPAQTRGDNSLQSGTSAESPSSLGTGAQ